MQHSQLSNTKMIRQGTCTNMPEGAIENERNKDSKHLKFYIKCTQLSRFSHVPILGTQSSHTWIYMITSNSLLARVRSFKLQTIQGCALSYGRTDSGQSGAKPSAFILTAPSCSATTNWRVSSYVCIHFTTDACAHTSLPSGIQILAP